MIFVDPKEIDAYRKMRCAEEIAYRLLASGGHTALAEMASALYEEAEHRLTAVREFEERASPGEAQARERERRSTT